MRIVWTSGADRDATELWEYIAADNAAAADGQIERIISAVTKLAKFPGMGRVGRCSGTHELVIGKSPYIVMYRVKDNVVEILRVIHERRRWPGTF